MRRPALSALLSLPLLACTPSGAADLSQAVEAMVEVKVEMRMAIEELRQARADLEGARAEIDRARADLDRSRRALDQARVALGGDADEAEPPTLSPRIPAEIADAVTCAEEGVCTIKRAAVDQILTDPTTLAKQARVVPAIRDGEALGFKLYGIRPGSLFKLFGVKNGDLIATVNGKPLRGINEAMEVYQSVRTASRFDLVGERKGEPLHLTITIVE